MAYANLLIHEADINRYSQVSVVVGTDGNDYYCILAHTAAVADKPITGANYATYWVATGGTGGGAVWVSGTVYAASIDGYGNPIVTWASVYADEPCRLVASSGREIKVGAEVVISDWKLFVDNSVTVTEQDRIDNIRLRSTGVIIDSATFEILLVQMRSDSMSEHHKELALQKVA